MAHPSTFAAGRRTGGERAGAAARHVPGQRLARVGSPSVFGRIEGIAVCVGASQTGHTARLVQKVCTSRSRRRWLVCLVLDTAALGPAGGSGTAEETEVTRMVAPLQSNGLLTAGALRGTTTTAREPAARWTARRRDAGAGQHGPRRANLPEHLKRSGHAVSPSRSTTAEEHPRLGCALGPRRGREPERSWTGSPTRTPQARGDSDRARRGRIALQARSPDSIGTRSSGEHGGAGTRDGSPPGIGPGARGNPHMDQRLDGGGSRAQELAQWPGPTGARRRRHDKVRSSVSQVSGARHRSGASQE